MSIFEAFILGLFQGLTEFIPVSSSGHLVLLHDMFGSTENTLAFDIALHLGTLIALLVFFRNDIMKLVKNALAKNDDGRLARLLIIATIPAGLAGLLFSDFIDDNLRSPLIVAIALAGVGVVMLVVDKYSKNNNSNKLVTTKQGLLVGFAQCLALIPGVSRSGATITTGLAVGLGRVQAAKFSFLLAIPIITGSALGILLKGADFSANGSLPLLVGMVTALFSGLSAIKFLLGVIGKVGLVPFAYYRFVVAGLVIVFLV
jgi:undecaprenyl-diphosphatase